MQNVNNNDQRDDSLEIGERRSPIWEAATTLRGAVPRGVQLAASFGMSIALILIWEAAVRLGAVNPVFLPAPSTVATTLVGMIVDGGLLQDAGISILRVWSAFLLAVIMAVPLGIMMSGYRLIGAALEPIIDFIRYLPVPAIVPLSIIWFGVGETTKIFLLWLGTFFQLVLLVSDEMRRVPHEYFEIAATIGAKPRQILRDVAFRAMMPGLLSNARITLGWCWTYLILAEIVAASNGLGFVIWSARRYMQTPSVMAGVLVIGIIGLATDQMLRRLEKSMFPYL
ncbi:ABC transporter permease [Rhizobium pusense]|uniref:ABC transporter permease n=1 Tax=Agrobacterium pusense TaxID=648995 RepID=UPI0024475328|nr:ABC transporter permease [Agrobacterium pusense]MDH2091631.1 ABC transporter permease [Agrobacterium pusense]